MKRWQIAFFLILSISTALAEDFKTVAGKEFKDATVIRVEGDGIVLRTKTGISKVYFVELPKDVQQRFRPAPATPTVAPIKQTPEQAHGGGKVVVVGQRAGSLKIIIAGIVLLVVVVLAIVRSRM